MFKDRQPLYVVVPPFMPDAKLMHSYCTFAQMNLSIDRLCPLATVRNDRLFCRQREKVSEWIVSRSSRFPFKLGRFYERQAHRAGAAG